MRLFSWILITNINIVYEWYFSVDLNSEALLMVFLRSTSFLVESLGWYLKCWNVLFANKDNLLDFFLSYLCSYFLSLSYYFGYDFKYWIQEESVNIFVSFLILEEMLSVLFLFSMYSPLMLWYVPIIHSFSWLSHDLS